MTDSTTHHEDLNEPTGLEIAIVGMACRFPGAPDVETYWRNLRDGIESLRRYSPEELEELGVDPQSARHSDYVPVTRSFEGFDRFDAGFFGISPREAEVLDPQQRVFLQCAWHALEDAGCDPQRYDGLIGLYGGGRMSTYLMNLLTNPKIVQTSGNLAIMTSNDKDYIATRVSYKLDLGGPSVSVQTACSTSLVATHLACQTLLSGECDMALAGGVSVNTSPPGHHYRRGEILCDDGHIRSFDAKATGTIFGNGVGFVALKRLEDAIADGDNIRAVIKGSAINNDASLKAGYTAPGADGQARVVRSAQLAAEVEADSLTYVETHGTGTPTGDPIEISALTRAFRESTDERQYCALGSAKTNIGHQSAAAGVAALIKTALALENKAIPPSLNFEDPNPQIDFENSPFFVNTELRPWPTDRGPRRAGVSAFGIGGTNAHAIVEEAPERAAGSPSRAAQLLVLSARNEKALDEATENLVGHLRAHPEQDLADIAYTLQVGRRRFEHRRYLVCDHHEDAIAALESVDPTRIRAAITKSGRRPVAFAFSGQGSQYPGMGRDLYDAEPTYRETVDQCCQVLEGPLGLDLRTLMFPSDDQLDTAAATLEETRFTQPALFVTEYALAKLWQSWGVEPEAMIGHSIGEYTAATLAGVFTLDNALALVAERGRLMHGLPTGSMLAVPLDEEAVRERLGPQLSIAAINATGRCVVSGPTEAVEALAATLKAEGTPARPLHTSHAFHSAMMEPVLAPFMDKVKAASPQSPNLPFVSNVSGTWITDDQATDPEYWALHLREAVRFADGVGTLLEDAGRVILEVGPGKTLSTLTARHPKRVPEHTVTSSLRHPRESKDDLTFLLQTLGQLWAADVDIDWQAFYQGERRLRQSLPTYPFQEKRYWVDIDPNASAVPGTAPAATRRALEEWFYQPVWQPSVAPVALDDLGGRWLVLGDGNGLGETVVAALESRDATVHHHPSVVAPEKGWNAVLEAHAGTDLRVIHLGGVTGDQSSDVATQRAHGFESLLSLVQALGRRGAEGETSLIAVADHSVAVAPGDRIEPTKALGLGPCLVIGSEHPDVRTAWIDIDPRATGDLAQQQRAERLIAEATVAKPGVLAYRADSRWRRHEVAIEIDQAAPKSLPWRSGGCYLVTGGLGGFGLTFAASLAERFEARLVLAGRTPLPEGAEADTWLASHPEDDRTSKKILAVRALEDAGAEVAVVAADITNADDAGRLVATAIERFGGLHGIIHAAGVAGGGLIQLKTADAAARVLAPKVDGTIALEAALRAHDAHPDFVVLCSSTIALLGTAGQVDYCAANSFLDAFAEAHADDEHTRWLSINWGAWQEVGMAVETPIAAGPKPVTSEPVVIVDQPLHALIDREFSRSDKETVFVTAFGEERHWVLAEHKINDTPALPGTSYPEMVRAALALERGEDPNRPTAIEVADLLFLQPLMVASGELANGRVSLRRAPAKGEDARVFQITSRTAAGERMHAQGTVMPLTDADRADPLDLAAIRDRCPQHIDIADGQIDGVEKLVYWGPRWRSLRTVHLGTDEGLAELVLPEAFHGDLDAFALHPALFDVATALASGVASGEGAYLPFSYRRIRVFGPIPAAIWSYLRLCPGTDGGGETVSVDVSLLDTEGREVVAIDHFTMKRVGGAIDRLAAPAPKAKSDTPAEKPAPAGLFASGGMMPDEGVEALDRLLSRTTGPRAVVSPRDLHATRTQMKLATADALAASAAPATGSGGGSHPRPDLATPFVAPSNPTEESLTAVWQSVLGLEEVGIHDNFFELGGDSVMGIQVIAGAAEIGLELSPEQLFEYQTVAELAVAGAAQGEPATPDETSASATEDEDEPVLSEDELDEVLAQLDA